MATIRIKLSPQLIQLGEKELLIEIDESVLPKEELKPKNEKILVSLHGKNHQGT